MGALGIIMGTAHLLSRRNRAYTIKPEQRSIQRGGVVAWS